MPDEDDRPRPVRIVGDVPTTTRRQKWEYFTEPFKSQDQLTTLGDQGWELVAVMVGVMPEGRIFVSDRPNRAAQQYLQ